MNLIQRISASVYSTVDKAVCKIENHDAIVEASIRECRGAAAKAHARNKRLQEDIRKLKDEIAHLTEAKANWIQRAKTVGHKDEEQALACLQRSKDCEQQLLAANESLNTHQRVEKKSQQNLRRVEQRLAEMTRQLNAMRAREASAKATNAFDQLNNNNSLAALDDTIERWEACINESEYLADCLQPYEDSLEETFAARETRDALRRELADLLDESSEEQKDD